jgi:phosphoribosyl 1,2-cyclic phosphodiesterase
MIIKFWGVRGSIPAPMASHEIKAKIVWALKHASGVDLSDQGAVEQYVDALPSRIRGTYGGNTPCVQVQSGDTTMIFDAGSGIRDLGLDLMERGFGQGTGTCHLFLSHTHWDHIQGFPFFVPAYVPGNRIIIHCPHPDIEDRLYMQQTASYFPVPFKSMQADIEFVPLAEGQHVAVGLLDVTSAKLNHPGGSFGYRVEEQGTAFVYATDTEVTNVSGSEMEKHVRFFSRAKVLVFDSQYTMMEALKKEDWGHSSSLKGVETANEAGVETLVLFHHEPAYDDNTLWDVLKRTRKYAEQHMLGRTCKIIMAYEGLELVV